MCLLWLNLAVLNPNRGSYLRKSRSQCWRNALLKSLLSCSPYPLLPEKHVTQVMEEGLSEDDDSIEDNSFALVPVEPTESVSCSDSVVVQDFPGVKTARLRLRSFFLGNLKSSENLFLRKMPLSRLLLRFPSSNHSAVVYPDKRHCGSDLNQGRDHSSELDGEKGAILLLESNVDFTPELPSESSKCLPKELEGLHEKYSSTCRLFIYQELLLATSNFKPGLFFLLNSLCLLLCCAKFNDWFFLTYRNS